MKKSDNSQAINPVLLCFSISVPLNTKPLILSHSHLVTSCLY